jgi:hypothetical protein
MRADPRETTAVAGGLLMLFPIGGFVALSALGPFIYPLPLTASLAAVLLSLPANYTFLACLIPTTLFWLLGIHLFIGAAEVPQRSRLLFWILAASTVVYFAMSWDLQMAGVIALNAIAVLILWRLLVRARRRPSFGRNLAFHWSLVAWLSWFAFPW